MKYDDEKYTVYTLKKDWKGVCFKLHTYWKNDIQSFEADDFIGF